MIAQETLTQIQHAPIVERIQVIEVILQSLKQDITQTETSEKPQYKPFKVRQFNLGTDIIVDRDAIYRERGL
jgi:hypothetical protein